MAVFAVARLMLPDLAASALGICVAAVGNFFLGDRLVFRRPVPVTQFDDEQQREPAA
jgi:putative flippase GtrA